MPFFPRQQICSLPARLKLTHGFSLLELLVTMGIIGLAMMLLMPSLSGRKQSGDFTNSVAKLAAALEQGRAYAMANNTHVFVGIAEFDASLSPSATPQRTASEQSGGRVVAVTIASRDGTSGYDSTSPGALSGSAIFMIGKVQQTDNLHLADLNAGSNPPTTGAMARPAAAPASRIGNANCLSLTPFSYPLNGTARYTFPTVIEFLPTGEAKIISQNGGASSKLIEIGLQPTHGNLVPPAPSNQSAGNHAAIQIDGLTGSIRTYRP